MSQLSSPHAPSRVRISHIASKHNKYIVQIVEGHFQVGDKGPHRPPHGVIALCTQTCNWSTHHAALETKSQLKRLVDHGRQVPVTTIRGFCPCYMHWSKTETTFPSDARMLKAHLPPSHLSALAPGPSCASMHPGGLRLPADMHIHILVSMHTGACTNAIPVA